MLDGKSAAVAMELTDVGLGTGKHKHCEQGVLFSSEKDGQSSAHLSRTGAGCLVLG